VRAGLFSCWESGHTLSAVARQVGEAVSFVLRWWQAYRRKGTRGLDAKPVAGLPPRLSAVEVRSLVGSAPETIG